MGFLQWLRGGRAGTSAGSIVGVMDEVFNPGAHRARQEMDQQNQRVIATPSPGDRLLDTGILETGIREVPKVVEDGTAP
jgi:hypothetical protein